jgi:hypothetical protein
VVTLVAFIFSIYTQGDEEGEICVVPGIDVDHIHLGSLEGDPRFYREEN